MQLPGLEFDLFPDHERCSLEVQSHLLSAGADPLMEISQIDPKRPVMNSFVHAALCESLVSRPTPSPDIQTTNPLSRHKEILRLYISLPQNPIDLNAKYQSSQNVLHLLLSQIESTVRSSPAYDDILNKVLLLLDAGVDITALDDRGKNCLQSMVESLRGQVGDDRIYIKRVVEVLAERGVELGPVDSEKLTCWLEIGGSWEETERERERRCDERGAHERMIGELRA